MFNPCSIIFGNSKRQIPMARLGHRDSKGRAAHGLRHAVGLHGGVQHGAQGQADSPRSSERSRVFFQQESNGKYPLVNCHITMERSTMLLMGQSTISMAMFNSYVKLPEGNGKYGITSQRWGETLDFLEVFNRVQGMLKWGGGFI